MANFSCSKALNKAHRAHIRKGGSICEFCEYSQYVSMNIDGHEQPSFFRGCTVAPEPIHPDAKLADCSMFEMSEQAREYEEVIYQCSV